MNVTLGKTGASLSPTTSKDNANGIENSCLACIVRTNQNGRFSKVDIERPNRPEIFDMKTGYTHDISPRRLEIGETRQCRPCSGYSSA